MTVNGLQLDVCEIQELGRCFLILSSGAQQLVIGSRMELKWLCWERNLSSLALGVGYATRTKSLNRRDPYPESGQVIRDEEPRQRTQMLRRCKLGRRKYALRELT